MKPTALPEISLRKILQEKEFWILNALGILFFYRPLFLNQTFYARDLHLIFYPQRARLLKILAGGEFPLWDPYLHGGQPFLAEINNAVLTPFLFLYFVFPLPLAMNVELVSQILLSGAGAYLLARVVGFNAISAFVTGSVYAYCGYTLSFVNLAHRLLALPYVPLLIAFLHLWLVQGRKKLFAVGVVVGALQICTGAFETVMMSWLILIVWSLAYPYTRMRLVRRLSFTLLFIAFACGVACVQILPTAEMILNSSRGSGYEYAVFSGWSLHPKRLAEMLIPRFLGYTNRLFLDDYWGAYLEGMHFPYVLSIYMGIPVMLLAFAAIGRRSNPLPRGFRFALAALIFWAALFSFGRHLPFFYYLYEHLPWIHTFRYPVKLLWITVLPLALLAGSSFQSLFSSAVIPNRSRGMPAVCFLISLLLAIWTLLFFYSSDLLNSFMEWYFGQRSEPAVVGLVESLFHATGVCLLLALIFLYRYIRPQPWHTWLLAGTVLLDLMLAGRPVNEFAPHSFFKKIPDLALRVRNEPGDHRFWREPNPPGIAYSIPAGDMQFLDRWNLETLHNYSGILYDIPLIFHEDYDGLAKKEIVDLQNLLLTLPWDQRLPLLSAGSVRLILAARKLDLSDLEEIGILRNGSNVLFHLYRNLRHAPRVSFVTSWRGMKSAGDTLVVLKDPIFDPRKEALIEGVADHRASCTPAQIREEFSGRNTSTIFIRTECDGHLLFAETSFPGWRIQVDGESAPQVRANYAFSAVFLKAGEHRVVRRYLPLSFLGGVALSLVSVILLGLFLRRRGGAEEEKS